MVNCWLCGKENAQNEVQIRSGSGEQLVRFECNNCHGSDFVCNPRVKRNVFEIHEHAKMLRSARGSVQ